MVMFTTVFQFFRQAFRMINLISLLKEQCKSIWPFWFTINTLSWVVCLPHKFSTFNSAAKREMRGVIVSWLKSKDSFSLLIAFEVVDSEKFNDFLGVEDPCISSSSWLESSCLGKTRTMEEDVSSILAYLAHHAYARNRLEARVKELDKFNCVEYFPTTRLTNSSW